MLPKSSQNITERHLPATGKMAKLFAKAGTGGQTQSSCCLSALNLKSSESGVLRNFGSFRIEPGFFGFIFTGIALSLHFCASRVEAECSFTGL